MKLIGVLSIARDDSYEKVGISYNLDNNNNDIQLYHRNNYRIRQQLLVLENIHTV